MNLSMFCSNERNILKQPFNIGDYTYASDGHIIVRIEKQTVFLDTKRDFADRVLGLPWEKTTNIVNPSKVPLFSIEGISCCRFCRGKGFAQDCEECGGGGTVCFSNDHNNYEFTCKSCGGNGSEGVDSGTPCPHCLGTSHNLSDNGIMVGDRKVSLMNLVRLERLAGVKLNVECDNRAVIPFSFDGGVGMIVPMAQ